MSSAFDIDAAFRDAHEVRDLVRALGIACLAQPDSTWNALERARRRNEEAAVRLVAAEDALAGIAHDDLAAVESALRSALPAGPLEPVDVETALRALCVTVVADWLEQRRPRFELRYGDVYPVPRRSSGASYAMTSSHHNTERMNPLRATGFRIWRAPDGTTPRVVLDFEYLEQLDVAAFPDGRLPTIATVHPHAGLEQLDAAVQYEPGLFFGLGPAALDDGAVLAQLQAAERAGASIAVLPEMSLPTSDALATTFAEHAAEVPPLIVAGSAHDAGTRTNRSRLYIEGTEALVHDKIQPYEWLDSDVRRLEDIRIGDEVVVLVGRASSVAVAICSDLLYDELVNRVVAAGVNTLLVPALTPKVGPFFEVPARVASAQRGVTAIANGSVLRADAAGQPFMAMFGAPRDGSHVQAARHPAVGGRRAVLCFDASRWRLKRLA